MLGFRTRNAPSAKDAPIAPPVAQETSVRRMLQPEDTAMQRASTDDVPAAATPRRLGSILIDEHLVAQEHIEEALAYQQEHGGFLGQILVEMGHLKQSELVLCLVKQCHIPHISLLDYDISKEVLQLVPKELCQTHDLIPIDKLGRILTVAMVNPLDTAALDEVKKVCPSLRIKPILCDWQHLKTVFARAFGASKRDIDETALPLGPKRQFSEAQTPPAPPEPQPSSPEVLAQLDAVAENLIRESAMDAVPESLASPEAPPIDITALARESVGGALQEAMANLMVGSKTGSWQPEVAPREEMRGLSPDDLNRTIRESVADAVQEAIVELSAHAKATATAPAAPSADLCEMIRDSVAAAVQEAMAVQAVVAQPASSAADQEALRAAVQDALLHDEAASVTRVSLQDLEVRDAERAKRQKHASVSTFAPTRAAMEGLEARLESDEHVLAALNSERLLDEFRFDSFVVGKGNGFTVKLCRAVASQPGGDYNPFFVYGDVGLGKTHLINAIGNAIMAAHPDARVGYVSSSRFATRLVEAVRDGAADAFRANYCHWDVLILDDIQFLGGRLDAQEEFFHIFNCLQQQGRQIIIASDKAPDRLGMLEQRLISRFSGGIVANVRPPEFETRLAILKKQMVQSGVEVSDEILALIATRVTRDMRKMIGALRKILAYANLLEEQVSCETANDILLQLGIDEAA